MKVALIDHEQQLLREKHIINNQEVAYRVADLYIAENVLTGLTRPIEIKELLAENSKRRILKG